MTLYVALWVGFTQQWQWVHAMDTSAISALHEYGSVRPGWVTFWDVLCTVLGPGAFRLATLVWIVVALVRRNFRVAVFLALTVEVSGLVTELAKAAADRPRPSEALVYAWSTSFPSGHALGLMVAVLAVLTVVLPHVGGGGRIWLCVAGAAVVVVIGAARVILNVHNPSDVLAGWALGYVWFVLVWLVAPPVAPVTEAGETPAAPGISR
ncbi:phosphatase PAP2 family protein [Mycolicibacterium agri]|uniref:Phosphatase PAP2 family protein n=1 Tax=Mycolicibacterium agri TaxID=36811 RepID=A0A7I9W6K0_MYCAG|nr:phosphatase PAP2 family protein [Mycolicibacterium agri]